MTKWRFLVIPLLVLFMFSCTGPKVRQLEKEKLEIAIFQNGREIKINDDTVDIKKNVFAVVIIFNSPDSVLVSASFEPETFNALQYGNPMEKVPGLQNAAIAEELFNKDGVLYVSKTTPGIWYYADDNDHRFNKIDKINSRFYCRRDIKKIIQLDNKNSQTEIMDITENAIYLSFIRTRWSEDFTQEVEISRRTLKINFSI